MKTSYYPGGGSSIDINFRFVGDPSVEKEAIKFFGYHTQNSTEYKASVELSFGEALDLIERLKRAVASMPCPCCGRKA